MGDNNQSGGSGSGNDPIPFSAPLPADKKTSVVPVAIAAFIGALAGAVVGAQLG